jgi:hypothetical protein
MSMHYSEHVKQGAAASRRTGKKNPLEIRAAIKDRHPTDSFEDLFEMWQKAVERDSECTRVVWLYAFRNYLTALDRDERDRRRSRVEGDRADTSAAASVMRTRRAKMAIDDSDSEIAERAKSRLVLMNLILPNGKRLQEATFADCKGAGAFFEKVAKLGKPKQIVGETVTEERLQSLID